MIEKLVDTDLLLDTLASLGVVLHVDLFHGAGLSSGPVGGGRGR